jgi:hypothetical protein
MHRILQAVSVSLIAFGLVFALPAVAAAADGFSKLPAGKSGRSSGLLMKIVRYEGSTNGAITVDVKNPLETPQEFSAQGVYFVPQAAADQAPQRLGAVGPFQVHSGNGPRRRDRLTIAPGATERLTLDVYCIDSHRASPTSHTRFRVAKDTMPEPLTAAIANDAHRSARALGGVSAPAAKSAVQSEVWKNRDKKWIELDGEGKQEANKHK